MRITNNLVFNNFRRNLQTASAELLKSQERMATQKLINRISDDPIAGNLAQEARRGLKTADQFLRNIVRASGQINVTETYMGQVEDLIMNAKELMLSQANSATTTNETRQAVATSVANLRDQLLSLANAQVGGRYIFGGTRNMVQPFNGTTATATAGAANGGDATITTVVVDETQVTGSDYEVQFTAPGIFDVVDVTNGLTVVTGATYVSGQPFTVAGVSITITDGAIPLAAGDLFQLDMELPGVYNGNSDVREVEIEDGTFVEMNIPGDRLFLGAGLTTGVNFFETLNDAVLALQNDDINGIDTALDRLDLALNQSSDLRSSLGASQSLFETTETRMKARVLELEKEVTILEDADLTDLATDFNKRDTAYQAALSVTARVGQVSLLDFLR